jgi:hypothetical protein
VCVFCARRHRDRRSSGSVDREMMWVWCTGWMGLTVILRTIQYIGYQRSVIV